MANNTNLNPENMDNLGPGNSTDNSTINPDSNKDVSPQGDNNPTVKKDKKYLGESELIKEPTKKLTLQLKDGSVTTNKIADGAVTMKKTLGIQAYIDNKGNVLQTQINSILRTLSSIGQGTAYDLTSEGGIVRLLMFIDDGQPYPAVVGTIPNGAVWYSPDDGLYHVWHDTTPEGETEQTGEWEEWLPTGKEVFFDTTNNKLCYYSTNLHKLVDFTGGGSAGNNQIIAPKAWLTSTPREPSLSEYNYGDYIVDLSAQQLKQLEDVEGTPQFVTVSPEQGECWLVYYDDMKVLFCLGNDTFDYFITKAVENEGRVNRVELEYYSHPIGSESITGVGISTVNNDETRSLEKVIRCATTTLPGVMSPSDKEHLDEISNLYENNYFASKEYVDTNIGQITGNVTDVKINGNTVVSNKVANINLYKERGKAIVINRGYWGGNNYTYTEGHTIWALPYDINSDKYAIIRVSSETDQDTITTGAHLLINQDDDNTPYLFIDGKIYSIGGGTIVETSEYDENSNYPASQKVTAAFIDAVVKDAAGQIIIPDYCQPDAPVMLQGESLWYDTANHILKFWTGIKYQNYLSKGGVAIVYIKRTYNDKDTHDAILYIQVNSNSTLVYSLTKGNEVNTNNLQNLPMYTPIGWDDNNLPAAQDGDAYYRPEEVRLLLYKSGKGWIVAPYTSYILNKPNTSDYYIFENGEPGVLIPLTVIDSVLDDTSTNSVQNKVVTRALNDLRTTLSISINDSTGKIIPVKVWGDDYQVRNDWQDGEFFYNERSKKLYVMEHNGMSPRAIGTYEDSDSGVIGDAFFLKNPNDSNLYYWKVGMLPVKVINANAANLYADNTEFQNWKSRILYIKYWQNELPTNDVSSGDYCFCPTSSKLNIASIVGNTATWREVHSNIASGEVYLLFNSTDSTLVSWGEGINARYPSSPIEDVFVGDTSKVHTDDYGRKIVRLSPSFDSDALDDSITDLQAWKGRVISIASENWQEGDVSNNGTTIGEYYFNASDSILKRWDGNTWAILDDETYIIENNGTIYLLIQGTSHTQLATMGDISDASNGAVMNILDSSGNPLPKNNNGAVSLRGYATELSVSLNYVSGFQMPVLLNNFKKENIEGIRKAVLVDEIVTGDVGTPGTLDESVRLSDPNEFNLVLSTSEEKLLLRYTHNDVAIFYSTWPRILGRILSSDSFSAEDLYYTIDSSIIKFWTYAGIELETDSIIAQRIADSKLSIDEFNRYVKIITPIGNGVIPTIGDYKLTTDSTYNCDRLSMWLGSSWSEVAVNFSCILSIGNALYKYKRTGVNSSQKEQISGNSSSVTSTSQIIICKYWQVGDDTLNQVEGDYRYNTTDDILSYYNGSSWVSTTPNTSCLYLNNSTNILYRWNTSVGKMLPVSSPENAVQTEGLIQLVDDLRAQSDELSAMMGDGVTALPENPFIGQCFFDTSVSPNGKPYWYAGNNVWVDATGTARQS